jgi:hypothetical protein
VQNVALPEPPPLQSSAVALAGFDQPLQAVLATLNLVGGNATSPAPFVFPYNTYQGWLLEFVTEALPSLRQIGLNSLSYLDLAGENILAGPNSVIATLGDAVWSFLPNAVNDGVIPAVQTFVGALTYAGQVAIDTGLTILNNMATNLGNVVAMIPQMQALVSDTTTGTLTVLSVAAQNVLTNIVTGFQDGGLGSGAAWNAAVAGLLGPGCGNGLGAGGCTPETLSIPGTLEAQWNGSGVNLSGGQLPTTLDNTVPPYPPTGQQYFFPSYRLWVQSAQYALTDALGGVDGVPTPPQLAISVAPVRSRAASRLPKVDRSPTGDSVNADEVDVVGDDRVQQDSVEMRGDAGPTRRSARIAQHRAR